MKTLWIVFFGVILHLNLWAQQNSVFITGKVVDSKKQPLAGCFLLLNLNYYLTICPSIIFGVLGVLGAESEVSEVSEVFLFFLNTTSC